MWSVKHSELFHILFFLRSLWNLVCFSHFQRISVHTNCISSGREAGTREGGTVRENLRCLMSPHWQSPRQSFQVVHFSTYHWPNQGSPFYCLGNIHVSLLVQTVIDRWHFSGYQYKLLGFFTMFPLCFIILKNICCPLFYLISFSSFSALPLNYMRRHLGGTYIHA